MRSYTETLEFLYNKLPVFQNIGKAAYKADLNNTIALAQALNNPQNSFRSIHVAGTNGKGSVSSLLAAIFSENGYKCGLYTSPHLLDFRERIRIDGEMISENEVIAFTEKIEPEIEKIKPSFFEITVAMAFDHFRRHKVDMAIVEVGMGGRLDSTNIITPELSIITNIGFDHMEFLGDTLEKIAAEKAGIIKKNVPVIIGEYTESTKEIFDLTALNNNSSITYADVFPDEWIQVCPLKGHYQHKNLATVHAAYKLVQNLKGFEFEDSRTLAGINNVKKWSGLRGRWEILSNDPFMVADTAHNKEGLSYTLNQLNELNANQIHFVLGFVNDKDLNKILPLFPGTAKYYFCSPPIFRGLDARMLSEKAAEFGLIGEYFESVQLAVQSAQQNCATNEVIYIGGSTFTVAAILENYKDA